MISLDTNYLIMGLVEGSRESENLVNWDEKGESFCVSSIATETSLATRNHRDFENFVDLGLELIG